MKRGDRRGFFMFANFSILISVIVVVAGQVCIKKGLNSLEDIDFASSILLAYLKIFLSPFVVLGISLYIIGVFFWLYALSKVDLSYAYPFTALSYVLVAFLSSFLLGEQISAIRWTGIIGICLGVLLISRG
jgi:drug/metabolite transporter (DMT)-like permease